MNINNNICISVVIPVYGSPQSLIPLCSRLKSSIGIISEDYEIILVNDCSPDDSWSIIKKIAEQDEKIVGINLSRNFGQHYAITAGLDHARGEWTVVMDCDLQDPPEEILNLYKKACEGYDIVIALRKNRKDSFLKKMSSKAFYHFFSYLTDTKQDGEAANFGIYNRKVINAIVSMKESLKYFPTTVKWVGFKRSSVNINHQEREHGKSSYSLSKLFKLAFNVIIAFSDKPLRLAIRLGFFIATISFSYAVFIVIRALMGIKGFEGWPSLIVSIWFLSGLIISLLGIIGVYLCRTFDEVKKRPVYIISEFIAKKDINNERMLM
ncbi:glycosyltransferase family 2 protein [Paenibacillus hodogayensis]|uniref:Glycosyltransferase family 2 protein n=1 Tax=Paenibacillus hodogayensis TaxID=279208 RepID=A0ABV5VS20_9BACL